MEKLNIKEGALNWLLEISDPDVRYLALRDLVSLPEDSAELVEAKERAHSLGPIAKILDAMDEKGYWGQPGAGYYPKYSGTVWSVMLLAQLGASASMDQRIEKACEYILEHALTQYGQFSISGTPSSTVDCLQGNLCSAMLDLGIYDARVEMALDWMARTVTGEGIAPLKAKHTPLRYYAGKCGPVFECGANNNLKCAWGGAKVLLAFGKLPLERRTEQINRAIQAGVDFFLGVDPSTADYPNGWAEKPSQNWWKFGFPVFYVTDLLQVCEALARLGYGRDPRMANALRLIQQKQTEAGVWNLEYSYTGKILLDFGEKKKPNKWVTLRALTALALAQ